MTSTIGLVEVIAPDLADSVVTGPPMDLSHQPMVTVSAQGPLLAPSGDTNLSWQRPLQFVQKMGQPFF